MTACPECTGLRIEDHPSGLTFKHQQSCSILQSEDATAAADAERLFDVYFTPYLRPATDAERTLLAACGFELPEGAETTVSSMVYPSVRRRTWPGFEEPTTEGETPA